jgi:uncharacterized protein (DUF1499 family)
VTTGILGVLGLLVLAAAVALVKLAADSRAANVDAGLVGGRLADCPASPNCVSSEAAPGDSHHIAPIADPDGAVWQRLIETVASMDGATLIASDDRYAYFTFTTRLLGFVDDVEFHYRPERGEIAVRSASRVGHGDLGANRRRVERIRSALAAAALP